MKQIKGQNWLWMLSVVSLVAAMPSLARADKDTVSKYVQTLSVSGQGEVMDSPDRAQVNLGAEAQARDASEATASVNSIMNRALSAIKQLGIDSDAIQTTQVRLYPVYAHLKPGDPGPADVVAYRATNQVRVTVDDLSLVGKVLDAANDAGANRQNGVHFELKDDTAAKLKALRLALSEARTKAQTIADALDLRIVEVYEVHESGMNIDYPRPYRGGALMMARESDSTPIESGQLTVRANVSVVYVIESR